MRQRDEDFLTMTDVTLQVLNKYKTVWQGNEPVEETVALITEAVADVTESRTGDAAAVSTGVTKDKAAAAADAIEKALELAGYAQVYARRKGNNTLLDQMKIKRKKLVTMDGSVLADVLEDLHRRLAALGEEAKPYGITADRLTRFKGAIAVYKPLKDAPRTVIVTRKGKRSNEPALLALIRTEWKNMDLLMPNFTEKNPQFVTDYKNARIVIDRGGGGSKEEKKKV